MTHAQLRSLSGWATVLGALAVLIGTIASDVLFPDSFNPSNAMNPLFVPLNLLGTIGALLVLLGLPGLYVSRYVDMGVAGFIGSVLIAVSAMLFGVFFGFFSVVFQPVIAAQAPQLISGEPPPALLVFVVVGTIIQVLGATLLALPMLRGSLRPRWGGYVLVVSAVLTVVSFSSPARIAVSTP